MFIIVGLGNPGKKYETTRHNVGFHSIDIIARRNQIEINKLKHKALYGEGFISTEKTILIKPQTFMNRSGESLLDVVKYYKIPAEQLILIYDDIDILVGSIRIREKGSAGTHNGMKSIVYQLQTDLFPRIRIGVGRPQNQDLADYVLSPFPKQEISLMREAIERASLAAEEIVTQGIQKAMNKYNA